METISQIFPDPMVGALLAIILFGLAFLVWAIGKLRQGTESSEEETLLPAESDVETPLSGDGNLSQVLESLDKSVAHAPVQEEPKVTPSIPPGAPKGELKGVSPTGNVPAKEMLDRLDNMTQRLAEMQTVLSQQANASPATASGTPSGHGFPPEAIDKLLKIIGNVTQQVDILQKGLTGTPTLASTPKPAATGATPSTAASPLPPMASTPLSKPVTTAPLAPSAPPKPSQGSTPPAAKTSDTTNAKPT